MMDTFSIHILLCSLIIVEFLINYTMDLCLTFAGVFIYILKDCVLLCVCVKRGDVYTYM